MIKLATIITMIFAVAPLCGQSVNRPYEQGYAVFYADYFQGRKTANGEAYDMAQFTCAHKTHPFGTLLRVTRLDNSNSVVVRVNDRGPFGDGLVVDISKAAAQKIDLLRDGKTRVRLEVVGISNQNPSRGRYANNQTGPSDYSVSKSTKANAGPRRPGTNLNPGYVPKQYDQPQPIRQKVDESLLGSKVNDAISAQPNNIPTGYGPSGQQNPLSSGLKTPDVKLGSIVIQLGAFGDLKNAQRQLNLLQNKGLNEAFIVETRRSNKILNRIIVGPYQSTLAAERALSNLKKQYTVGAVVTTL